MPIFDVRHQARAQRLIQRALASERLPHAYVFHGPDGVGKETLAVGLARILLCPSCREVDVSSLVEFGGWEGPMRDACGVCDDCRAVEAESHPDLHRIYRQLNRFHPDPTIRDRKALDLGVDVIRHFVVDAVGAKPARDRAKVFIIREADHITPGAQNALLKTLEEPPPTTFLILLVSSLDALLPTTRSRCHLVSFAPLPREYIGQKLRELRPDLSGAQAELIARFAQGSLGDALQHADDGLTEYNDRLAALLLEIRSASATAVARQLMDEAKSLGGAYRKRDPDISDTDAQRRGLNVLLSLAATRYRDSIHHTLNTAELAANPLAVGSAAQGTGLLAPATAADAISAIRTAERQLDLNANVQLCLESLVVKLARLTSAS